jgi:hypothetical protein
MVSKTEFVTGGYAPNFMGMSFEKPMEGGITAGIKLEQGFLLSSPPDGGSQYFFGSDSGDLFNRQANIYIKSAAGTFVAGKQSNLAFNTVLLGDPRSGSNYGSSLAALDAQGSLNTVDNASFSYTSPSLNGFTVAAQYVPESITEVGKIKSGNRLSLTYANGPATFGMATYSNEINGQTAKNQGSIFSGNYKLGDFTLKGIYADQKTATYTQSLKTSGLGGAYALNGKTTLDLGYFNSTSNIGSFKTNTYAAGVQYKLIKDLAIYGQYAKVDNKGSSTAVYNFAPPTIASGVINAGQTGTTLNIGLLYSYF